MWGLLRDVSWSLSERGLILNAGHTSWQESPRVPVALAAYVADGNGSTGDGCEAAAPKPDIKIRAPPPARPGLLLSRGRAEPLTPPLHP